MKIIVLFILALSLRPSWVVEIDETIKKIDGEGILRKEKVFEDAWNRNEKRIYRLEKWTKLEWILKSYSRFRYDSQLKMYLFNGDFVAEHDRSSQLYLHKGGQMVRGDGVIEEVLTYYKNEEEGIRYSRRIEFQDTSQIDSLKIALLQLPFEEIVMTHADYTKSFERHKRMLKYMRMSDAKRERLNRKYLRKNERLTKKRWKEWNSK